MYSEHRPGKDSHPFSSTKLKKEWEKVADKCTQAENYLPLYKRLTIMRNRGEIDQRDSPYPFHEIKQEDRNTRFPSKNSLDIIGPRISTPMVPYILMIHYFAQQYGTRNRSEQICRDSK